MDTSFKRGCMFCRMEFCGSRAIYIKHLYQKHNLHFGKPENLVFIDELLDKIQSTIERYIIPKSFISNLHIIQVNAFTRMLIKCIKKLPMPIFLA